MSNKVIFLGSKSLGYSILERMCEINRSSLDSIITFDDRNDSRSKLEKFENFASKKSIKLYILDGPKGLSKIIKNHKPDLVMVIGWYWIIPKTLIDFVVKGFIGIHGSLLPSYRGFAPFVWSLINGDRKTGISMFYLSKGIDDGDIIDQEEIIIDDNTNISTLLNVAELKSIKLINKNYKDILEGTNNRKSQSTTNITYCSLRKPDDGIINWSNTNINIHNFIRAQSDPYPGAFSYLGNKKYYFIESKIVKEKYYGVMGLVAKKNNNSIVVCCGENAIEITHLRLEGSDENVVNSITFGNKFTSKI